MEEKQKGDDGDDIKEELKEHGEKKAQNEDDEAEQEDSVTTEQDNGKDNKEKDSVKRLPLNTLGTRFPVRGLGGGGDSYLRYADLYTPLPLRAYCPFN